MCSDGCMPDERVPPAPPVGPLARTEQRILATAGLLIVLVVLIAAVAGTSDGGPDEPAEAASGTTATTTTAVTATTSRPPTPPPGVVADPDDLAVLVDRERRLPEGWQPAELVEVPVPFTFEDPDPRRLMRPEPAAALAELFAAAERDRLPLRAVSGFRSEEAQRNVHAAYVAEEGVEAAERFSARPGHSEHQTGLAVDVTSYDGACPAEACFADRPEAAWLVDNADRFGFVVRYPSGREAVTGYEYEPWHLRYVGPELAGALSEQGLTLDEWYGTGG